MENKLQNLKFRVYSEEHSKAIQEKLLEIGYNFEPRHFDKKYLFIFSDNTISFCITEEVFVQCEKPILLTIDDLYKMQAEPNPQSELMTKLESLQKEIDELVEFVNELIYFDEENQDYFIKIIRSKDNSNILKYIKKGA